MTVSVVWDDRFVGACRHLIDLNVGFFDSAGFTYKALSIPTLESFTVTGSQSSVIPVLDTLVLPRLKKLVIQTEGTVLQSMLKLLERSECTLEELDTSLADISDAELGTFLAHCSNAHFKTLRSLRIFLTIHSSPGGIYIKLHKYCEADYYLPELQEFRLIMPTCDLSLKRTVLDMLNCPSLRRIDFGDSIHDLRPIRNFLDRSSAFPVSLELGINFGPSPEL
ncbi:hypothetical protein MPER_06355, partial [Moniliophthora perniciosa FA553]